MRIQRFSMLLSGQMFMVPRGQSGAECLWIKKSPKVAKSYPPTWGSCSFDPDDEIIEVNTTKMAKLVIADQRS